MKKINLLLIAITALLTFSCSSDDEGGNENSNNDLIGTYTVASIITAEQIDTNGDGTLEPVNLTDIFDCNGLIIIQEETMSYREVLPQVFNDGNSTSPICNVNGDRQGTYSSNNTGLIFNTTFSNGDPLTFTFQIENGNLFYSRQISTPNGGSVNATITFSR